MEVSRFFRQLLPNSKTTTRQVSILGLIVRINLEGAPSTFAILAVRNTSDEIGAADGVGAAA